MKFWIVLLALVGGWYVYQGNANKPAQEDVRVAESQVKELHTKQGITLISATWCGYCDKLRKQLNASNVPFTEYDVEHSLVGKMYSDAQRLKGVPITIVNGNAIEGYDANKLPAAFASVGYSVSGF